ncbi:oligosaccharide flippase family protein [Chloroflexota bacterium]
MTVFNDDMARHGTIMVVFGLLAGAINYLFQLAMGIMLTPAEYGTFYSLLSLLVILSFFSNTINTVVTKFISIYKSNGMLEQFRFLWGYFTKRAVIISLVVFVVLMAMVPVISDFLQVTNKWYVAILVFALIFTLILPVNFGILRGLQRFIPLGLLNNLSAVFKLGFGVLLVGLGWGVYGGLIGFFLAQLLVLCASTLFLRDLIRVKSERVEVKELKSSLGLTLLVLSAFTIMSNIDVVLVKHYFSPEAVGSYSAISVLGKVAFIASGGISVAMFPKTTETANLGSSSQRILWKALFLTLMISGVVVLVYWLFSDFIVMVLFADKYTGISPHLVKYGIAMTFYAISYLLMHYSISLNHTKVAYTFTGTMVVQIFLIIVYHSSLAQVIDIMIISGGLSIISTLPFCFRLGQKVPQRAI